MRKGFRAILLLFGFLYILNLSGCGYATQPGGYFYFALVNTQHYNSDEESVSPLLIDPYYVLISSRTQFDNVFAENTSVYPSTGFTEKASDYNDEFFENNQLVSFISQASSGGYSYRLLKTNYVDGVLTIKIEKKAPQGGATMAIQHRLAIIEIEKVPEDTLVEVEYTNGSWFFYC